MPVFRSVELKVRALGERGNGVECEQGRNGEERT